MDDARAAWITLALADGVGPRILARLLEELPDVVSVVRASGGTLARFLGPRRGRTVRAALDAVRPARAFAAAAETGQRILTPADPDWPAEAFAALVDAPMALFLRGTLPDPAIAALAVVGTREAGPFGLRTARRIAEDLAAQGHPVLSGLALGIDGAAHAGALAGARGTDMPCATVAVLGCGIDVAYPVEHVGLKEEIARAGAVISEHPPGTPPQPGHFPRRNRIVAALARAILVVEAPLKSGALLTAGLGLDMGRDVLVVPGPAGRPSFRGGHRLLRRQEGWLCEDARDVLESIGLAGPASAPTPERVRPASGAPLAVWGVIGEDEALDPDEICRRTGLDVGTVLQAVARLEIDGHVRRVPGVGVRRA